MGRKNATEGRIRHAEPKLRKVKKRKRNRRRDPLTRDQQGLASRYLPMARALAKPMKEAWPTESDEFESAACLALVEAAQSFDASRNVKFATFARYRIWGALRDVQRSLITTGWRGDLENAPRFTSFSDGIEEYGRILNAEPDSPVDEEIDSVDAVESWLRKLPNQHAAALRQLYIHEKTQAEAAAAIGCSKSRLSYLHKESLRMLNDCVRWMKPARTADADADADSDDEAIDC